MASTTLDEFKHVAEVEVDERKRVSLGRIGVQSHQRYLVYEGPHGEICLVPAKTVPAREAIIWENEPLRDSLKRGMEQAAGGKTRSLGSFREFGDEGDE